MERVDLYDAYVVLKAERRPRKRWILAGAFSPDDRMAMHAMNRQLRIDLYKHARERKKAMYRVLSRKQFAVAAFTVKGRRPRKKSEYAYAITFRRER